MRRHTRDRVPDPVPAGAPVEPSADVSVESSVDGLAWSRVPRGWRWTTYIAVGTVLALGFWAYQSPEMRINWEAVAALCGF